MKNKLTKSEAVNTLLSRMVPVIDSSAVNKVFNIALSMQEDDHQAQVVELLAVCYSVHLFITCCKVTRSEWSSVSIIVTVLLQRLTGGSAKFYNNNI